jgi:hypothetical protein
MKISEDMPQDITASDLQAGMTIESVDQTNPDIDGSIVGWRVAEVQKGILLGTLSEYTILLVLDRDALVSSTPCANCGSFELVIDERRDARCLGCGAFMVPCMPAPTRSAYLRATDKIRVTR